MRRSLSRPSQRGRSSRKGASAVLARCGLSSSWGTSNSRRGGSCKPPRPLPTNPRRWSEHSPDSPFDARGIEQTLVLYGLDLRMVLGIRLHYVQALPVGCKVRKALQPHDVLSRSDAYQDLDLVPRLLLHVCRNRMCPFQRAGSVLDDAGSHTRNDHLGSLL